MIDANTICHDVDLLGDWLDAKGYTEEAGLCLRVLGLIHEQAEENENLTERINNLQEIVREDTEEILKLRSALRLIFSCGVQQEDILSNKYKIVIPEYVLSEVEGLMNEAMGKYAK